MIKITDLRKVFISKSKEQICALDGISMDLPDTGLVFILGESGSGKSTLLNIIGGIERSDSGSVIVDGKDIVVCSDCDLDIYRNKDVGFIFQEFNLLSNFNVGDNIKLARDLQSGADGESAVEDALTAVNMQGYSMRRVNELSGGQKQRVAIARAIVKKPKIVLADEPTGSLDSKTGAAVLELLKGMSTESLVLVVSHDEKFAQEYADIIIRIDKGKVIESTSRSDNTDSGLDCAKNRDSIREGEKSKKIRRFSLSSKTVARMAIFNLNTKKVRLALTIIMCVVCMVAFGIADAVASWNYVDAGLDALVSSGEHILTVSQYNGLENAHLYDSVVYGKQGVKLRINELVLPEIDNITDYGYGFYPRIIDGFCEITEETAINQGFELYSGRYPKEFGEVAIPYHIFRAFKIGEYSSATLTIDGSELSADDGEKGIIGKNITVNLGWSKLSLNVVGIIDTKFNYGGYPKEDPESESFQKDIWFSNPSVIYSGHNALFVSKGDVAKLDSSMRKIDFEIGVYSFGTLYFKNEDLKEIQSFISARYSADLKDLQEKGVDVYWFGEEKSQLEENEAIISYLDIEIF